MLLLGRIQKSLASVSYESGRGLGGELAQQLRALVVLLEDMGSVPSTYMVAHNLL